MSSEASSLWPIRTELPSELAFLANHISTYFNADPPYNKATLGGLIFTPPPRPPKLLLVQVEKSSEPEAFSRAWEIPNGLPKASDVTLLHALARVVLEQTGLHLSRVYSMSGSQVGPEPENPTWMRLQFTIQVSELEYDQNIFSEHRAIADQAGSLKDHSLNSARSHGLDTASVPVQLNPNLHCQHAWVTEDEIREFVRTGLYPTDATKQYESILDAFELYKQDWLQVETQDEKGKSTAKSYVPVTVSMEQAESSMARTSSPGQNKSSQKSSKSGSRPTSSNKSKPDPSHFHRFRIT